MLKRVIGSATTLKIYPDNCLNDEKVLVFVAWNKLKEEKPFKNIIFDAYPDFELASFDFSGMATSADQVISNIVVKKKKISIDYKILSRKTEGKSQVIACIIESLKTDPRRYSYIGIFDDDILIRVSAINKAIKIGMSKKLSTFQPSLSSNSYYAHKFTLNRNKVLQKCAWTEIMVPFIKAELLLKCEPFLSGIVSSWGVDCFVIPIVALVERIGSGHAVIHASLATHLKPIRAGAKAFKNGRTSKQEMEMMRDRCAKYVQDTSPGMINNHKIKKLLLQFL